MKKYIVRYFIAGFFVCIYLIKGGASLAPSLLVFEKNDYLFALLMDIEKEGEKSNNGEKPDAETKEFYQHAGAFINPNLPGTLITKIKTSTLTSSYIQQVYASIPTPPPELS
jgi:hypothetical protein